VTARYCHCRKRSSTYGFNRNEIGQFLHPEVLFKGGPLTGFSVDSDPQEPRFNGLKHPLS